ncbi:AbiV family abortive infection protein [Kocuria rhizophila]|nr:AbiV family abortive infection protein [Kocuria rhizophila]
MSVLRQHGRNHTKKDPEASRYGDELAVLFGAITAHVQLHAGGRALEAAWIGRKKEAEAAAVKANLAKQRGFYVDRDDDGAVLSPTLTDAPLPRISRSPRGR